MSGLRRCWSRRYFLTSAARAGLASMALPRGVLLGASGAAQASRSDPGTWQPLLQPQDIRSENGVLRATLAAAPDQFRLGEVAFDGFLYNGSYLPPLLRPRVGDTMRITFKNDLLDDPSNLHFHGMAVSPQGHSDNVFIHVHPGHQFDYEVQIPAKGRQRPGLFWYHPHAHGFAAKQILGGMSGGLVVDGFDELFPIVASLPEQFFLIKHAEPGGDREIISINGQLNPVVKIRPGEMQFWRIANIGATLFIKFKIEGMPLYILAIDGHPRSRPDRATEFFIGPGQRIDAIAIGPQPGEYAMGTISFQNQAWKKPDPSQLLATILCDGPEAQAQARAQAQAETELLNQRVATVRWFDDVRSTPIAHRRTLVYSRTPDRRVFMINGRVMDENRVDQTVKLGDTEEWTVINTDQQYHSFHIHQTGFLVSEVNGIRQHEDSLRDTYSMLPATVDGPSVLKVVIPFTDPVIVGRFVYHCHAVDHEDKGMMGVIEVTP
jgi:FtsP/CotA-like multicopper oxidase with cupredoxin domain